MQAAVLGAVGFHQWSGQPPTMRRVMARRSHQLTGRFPAPPSITLSVTVVATGIASAFIVIGL